MRQPIETVPKDGTGLILQDELTGRCEIVRWSPFQNGWISPDGRSCEIAATCWYPFKADHPMHAAENTKKVDSTVGNFDSVNGDLPITVPSPPVQPLAEHSGHESSLPSFTSTEVSTGTSTEVATGAFCEKNRQAGSDRRRKLGVGVAMIVASIVGIYFRPEFAAWAGRPVPPNSVNAIGSAETVASHPPILAQVGDLAAPIEHLNHPAPAMSDLRENLDKEIAQWRQEIAESHHREELQKESVAELRRSLEDAQARISRLENQLNLAQQNEKLGVSRKQARRVERQGRNRAPREFFGRFATPQ